MKYTIDYKMFYDQLRRFYYDYKNGQMSEVGFIEHYREEMVHIVKSSEGKYVIYLEEEVTK